MSDAVIQTAMRCGTAIACTATFIGGLRWIVASVVKDLEDVSIEGGKNGAVKIKKKCRISKLDRAGRMPAVRENHD